jgi:peptidoglycan-N-acetylglucosamine deacetylase
MKVALTFDDGPDPNATPELLELLKREGISATFFCIGKNVEANPDIAKRIAGEGHLLANHSYTHPWYISMLMGRALRREMERTQEAIERAARVRPKYFRPPSGTTGPNFPGALKRVGLTLVGWDVRSLDTVATPKKAVERIVRLAGDGSIILLHDGGAEPGRVVEIVSAAVKELRSRGFGFERVDRLIEETEGPHPDPLPEYQERG